MSGQQIGTVVGTVVGAYFGYPQLGAVLGSLIGGAVDPPEGPDPGGLTGPKVQLGASFGRPYGVVRYTVSWISIDDEFRAVGGSSGGKGGADAPTAATFEIDALGLVCDTARVKEVLREWANKKLIASRAPGTTSPGDTSDYYGSVLDQFGLPGQAPAPLYEARVGAANALSYPDMFTREYASINCGPVKTIPVTEVEVSTVAPTVLQTFNYTGADQTYTYSGTESAVRLFLIWGGDGGDATTTGKGGGGGFVRVARVCTPGQQFRIVVGGQGAENAIATSYGGGGSGGVTGPSRYGGGGGGRSGVYLVSDDSPVGIAGGGGGGGTTEDGGGGGDPTAPGPTESGGTGSNFEVGDPPDWASGGGGGGANGGAGGLADLDIGGGGQGGSSYALGGYAIAGTAGGAKGNSTHPNAPGAGAGRVVVASVGAESLADVILAELERIAGFNLADVDVTDVEDVEVASYNAIGKPHEVIADLCAVYDVDVVPGAPIKFLKKGRAVVGTIPWVDTGAGVGQAGNPFEGLKQGNNDEIAGVVGVQFIDLNRDHNANFVRGDRLNSEGPDITRLSTNAGLTPDEAKGRAITATLVNRMRKNSAEFALSNLYAAAEPSDCYTVADRDGNAYRLRINSLSYSDTVRSCKWELDDASAYVRTALTDMTDTPTIDVVVPESVEFLVANLPALRDDDAAGPGVYAVMWWGGTAAVTAALYTATATSGPYAAVGSVSRSATVGTVSGALGDWTGGWVWDNVNTAQVVLEVDPMALASSTYAGIYGDPTGQLAAIGDEGRWEIVAFRTATLTAARTYTLSGLLRGLGGTEWAMGLHEAGDRFILLDNNGLLRVPHQAAEIGAVRYYRAGRAGQGTAGLPTLSLTDDGTSLKPLAPVNLRASVSGGNVTVTWERRSRLSVPPYAEPLLSDAPETYYAELRNGGTVVSSQTVTARSVTFTHTAGYTVAVVQRNAIAGNGYDAEITV